MTVKVQIDASEFLQALEEHLDEKCKEICDQIKVDAKRTVAFKDETGALRKSIKVKKSKFEGGGYIVKAGGRGAMQCIFGGDTRVVTEHRGPLGISSVKVGDKVLTQTGEYRSVVSKHSFPAVDKPDLIDMVVYDVNKCSKHHHKLTVTDDHKMLVFREGKNQWIKAGDLVLTDKLFIRKRMAKNKGTGCSKKCAFCGEMFGSGVNGIRARKESVYCTIKCRDAAYATDMNPHIGSKRSDESKKRMSVKRLEMISENPGLHPNRLAGGQKQTRIEKEVEAWLKDGGRKYVSQYEVNSLFLDFYLPDENIVYEVDGGYWHKDQKKDIERDKKILEAIDGVKIFHIHFIVGDSAKGIDINPIENVFYIPCNPGISTFVNVDLFENTHIISLTKKRYDKGQTKLYDLSIEGVHSFFANGVLTSNSWLVEHGHGGPHPAPARPYLKPALDKNIAFAKRKLSEKMSEPGYTKPPSTFGLDD